MILLKRLLLGFLPLLGFALLRIVQLSPNTTTTTTNDNNYNNSNNNNNDDNNFGLYILIKLHYPYIKDERKYKSRLLLDW